MLDRLHLTHPGVVYTLTTAGYPLPPLNLSFRQCTICIHFLKGKGLVFYEVNFKLFVSDMDEDGSYSWDFSRTISSYNDWAPDYPMVNSNLNCVRTPMGLSDNRRWKNEYCTSYFPAICQPIGKKHNFTICNFFNTTWRDCPLQHFKNYSI